MKEKFSHDFSTNLALRKDAEGISANRKNCTRIAISSDEETTFDGSIVEKIIFLPTENTVHPVVKFKRPFKTYIICQCKGKYFRSELAELTNNDILCLQESKFINNYVVDMFMALNSKTKEWNHISFLPCAFTLYILGDLWEIMSTLPSHHWLFNHCSEPPDDFEDLVFLPYTSQNHWGLVVLDCRHFTFFHYDSLGLHAAELIKYRFNQFLEHSRKIEKCPLGLSSRNWTKIDVTEN